MNSDFKDLLRLFNAKKVKYLIVGGYAVIRYSEPRYTGDIDILVQPNLENATLVFEALKEFGAPISTLTEKDFSEPGYFFQMGTPPNRIDILMSIQGVEFNDAWERRVESTVGEDTLLFISKEDLITAKKAAGRTKDLADLEALMK